MKSVWSARAGLAWMCVVCATVGLGCPSEETPPEPDVIEQDEGPPTGDEGTTTTGDEGTTTGDEGTTTGDEGTTTGDEGTTTGDEGTTTGDEGTTTGDVPDVPDPDVPDEGPDPDEGPPPCEGEDCPENHPCQTSDEPESADPEVTDCVCELDSYCCDVEWDDTCVDTAESDCEVLCGCEAGETTCEADADCGSCGDGDVCAGQWLCDEGICAFADGLVCEDDNGEDCLVPECDATDGCVLVPSLTACDDDDVCTDDLCDAESGTCTSFAISGCGGGDPCVPHAWPGSTSDEADACVCALDEYCCNVEWDETCALLAVDDCDHSCACGAAEADDIACTEDADCLLCSADLCATPWSCQEGTCAVAEAVDCDTSSDSECIKTACEPTTGLCDVTISDALCDDENDCTQDVCFAETGECGHLTDPLCGLVCGEDTIPCEGDADCAPCQGDLCVSSWSCVEGACVEADKPACEATDCDVAVCDPAVGECVITELECGNTDPCEPSMTGGSNDAELSACVCAIEPLCCTDAWDETCILLAEAGCGLDCACDGGCADDDACTIDTCDVETDTCANTPIEGCTEPPSYTCNGAEEPALMGCDTVDTDEGCCDPWGRLVWCDGGNTYCIDCASHAPLCGWSSDDGFYDCGGDGAEDPSGQFPIQCSGLGE